MAGARQASGTILLHSARGGGAGGVLLAMAYLVGEGGETREGAARRLRLLVPAARPGSAAPPVAALAEELPPAAELALRAFARNHLRSRIEIERPTADIQFGCAPDAEAGADADASAGAAGAAADTTPEAASFDATVGDEPAAGKAAAAAGEHVSAGFWDRDAKGHAVFNLPASSKAAKVVVEYLPGARKHADAADGSGTTHFVG
jgi:hypothetical protein